MAILLNSLKGVAPISYSLHDFRLTVLGVCIGVAIIIFVIMIFALIRHRKRAEHAVAQFHKYLWLEMVWTLMPIIILIFIVVFAIKPKFFC